MRRIAVIVPGWLADGEEGSQLLRPGEPLRTWVEAASVQAVRLGPDEPVACPDAAYLGLDPRSMDAQPGPLAAACFGSRPPWGSTVFHLSLMGTDGREVWNAESLSDEEASALVGAARALETAESRLVEGEGPDHALVTRWPFPEQPPLWPRPLLQAGYRAAVDELDRRLRRWVDDSANLLSEHEVNLRRADLGLRPANLLWPWGPGEAHAYLPWSPDPRLRPTLASGSIRLHGMARLVGLPVWPRSLFRGRAEAPLERLAEMAFDTDRLLIHLPEFGRARLQGDLDRLAWLQRWLEEGLIQPLLDQARKRPTRLMLVALSEGLGLVGVADSERPTPKGVPFDERAIAEGEPPSRFLHEAVRGLFEDEP
ncbi:MAG: hypothetical protein WHU10_04125 [Fimbriimonadales bacterium]